MDPAATGEAACDAPLVLVSSAEGGRHALPARSVADGLARAGWAVHYAGDDPEPGDLLHQVLALEPHAVCLSASLHSTLAHVRPLFASLAAIGVPVVVGGRAFGDDPQRALRLGATAYAADASAAVEIIRALPRRLVRPERAGGSVRAADDEAAWIVAHLPALAAASLGGLGATPAAVGVGRAELTGHARHLLGSLAAALVAGEAAIVEETHDWLAETLRSLGADDGLLTALRTGVLRVLRGRDLARGLLEAAAPGAGEEDGVSA